ncbi:MAG: hypothetical protein EXR99_11600 [Gemmataceae bacterium]|nr:hypothetical protein [Gemmataceae bacterium]
MFRSLGLFIASVTLLGCLFGWRYLLAQEKGKGQKEITVRTEGAGQERIRLLQPGKDGEIRLLLAQEQPKIKALKPDSDLDAWLKTLAPKIADRHDKIRESARQAILAAGPYAIDMLNDLAKSNDNATAIAAKGLLERIDQPVLAYATAAPGVNYRLITPPYEKKNEDVKKDEGRKEERKKANTPDRPDFFKKDGKKADARPFGPEAREKLFRDLDLTPDVKAKVQDVLSSQQQAMRALMEKARAEGADQAKVMEETREIREAFVKTMREILGPDKFQKFMDLAPGPGQFEKKSKSSPRPERPKG